jgi:hypothetical protein
VKLANKFDNIDDDSDKIGRLLVNELQASLTCIVQAVSSVTMTDMSVF